MKQKFKLGDTVKIVKLHSPDGVWAGKRGHVGKIIKIDKGEGYYDDTVFYELHPYCPGRCWPADCLELVKPAKKKKIKGVLFDINDL